MNARIRYTLGLCLQVVGLLNFVFLIGVPIWLAGRRLCRDARTDDRSPSLVERRPTDRGSTHTYPSASDSSRSNRSSPAHPPESRSERHAPTQRN